MILPDGTNVNQELVKEGWCWWYRKYAPGDTVLEGLEKEAREAGKACGLIRSRCRRGSGGRRAVETKRDNRLLPPAYASCTPCSKTCLVTENGEVDFSRALTYHSACSKNK